MYRFSVEKLVGSMATQKSKPSRQTNGKKTVRAYEEVIQKVRQLIEGDDLGPGDLLPPERQLAEQFKVSRHSLREAIRVLQEQGVLATRQGSGNFIQASSKADLIRALNISAMPSAQKVHDLFQIREIIEPQMARLAASNANSEDRKQIAEIADRLSAVADFSEGQALDHEFHETIAAATGNQLLHSILQEINKSMLPSASSSKEKKRRKEVSNAGHAAIVEAIEKRDADAAETAMREHIAAIRSEIV